MADNLNSTDDLLCDNQANYNKLCSIPKPSIINQFKPHIPVITILSPSAINISYPKYLESTLYIIDEMVNLFPYQCCCRSDESFCVYNLKPNLVYMFRLIVCYGNERTQPSEWAEITFENTVPDPPSNLEATISSGIIEIVWKKATNHHFNYTLYELDVDESNDSNFKVCYAGYSCKYSFTIKNPSSNVIQFRIRACNMIGWSDYTSIRCFIIDENCNFNDFFVDAPKLIEATPNSLHISWKDSVKNNNSKNFISTEYYEIEMINNDIEETVYCGNDTSFILTNLNPASLYELKLTVKFIICGNIENFISKSSPILLASTLADVPGPVSNFQLTILDSVNSFEFCWDPPNNSIATDVITYLFKIKNCKSKKIIVLEGTDNHVIITNLNPCVQYECQVSCIGFSGIGQWSKILSFETTLSSPDVPILSRIQFPDSEGEISNCFVRQNNQSFDIIYQWDRPKYTGGSITLLYEVQLYDHLHKSWYIIYFGQKNSCSVAKTFPNSEYSIRVRCSNELYFGAFTTIITFKTHPSYPSQPLDVNCLSISPNNLLITWKNPHHDGGSPILNFSLFIQQIKIFERKMLLNYYVLSFNTYQFLLQYSSVDCIKVLVKAINKFGYSDNTAPKFFYVMPQFKSIELPNLDFIADTKILTLKWELDSHFLMIDNQNLLMKIVDNNISIDLLKYVSSNIIEYNLPFDDNLSFPVELNFVIPNDDTLEIKNSKQNNMIKSFTVYSIYSNMIQLTWKVTSSVNNSFQLKYRLFNKKPEIVVYNPMTTNNNTFFYFLKNLRPNSLYEIELSVKMNEKFKNSKQSHFKPSQWLPYDKVLKAKTLPLIESTIIDINTQYFNQIGNEHIIIDWVAENTSSNTRFCLEESHIVDNVFTNFVEIYNGYKCSFILYDIGTNFHYRFRVSVDSINKTYVQCSLKYLSKQQSTTTSTLSPSLGSNYQTTHQSYRSLYIRQSFYEIFKKYLLQHKVFLLILLFAWLLVYQLSVT